MSIATEQEFQGFAEAKVQKQPTLACVGTVDEVGDGKVSESGLYVVQPFKLRAKTPGRNVSTNILYRPEWLNPNFDPNSLEAADTEEDNSGSRMLSVYRRHINVKGGVSSLAGLSGSAAGFKRLAHSLLNLTDEQKEQPAVVSAMLRDFFTVKNEGVDVGYILRQRRDQVGENEEGKKIYELANGYEVNEYFFPTAEKLKALRQRAERSKGTFKFAFDEE